eukprot:gnl/TRDRNA2_/TRDRNA2_173472_c0_seq1.p1 gnl/TRDRNA2_/TRDRNA2_173472_c0~~gnl/TRDRNA2_/TRDRNA2_173472_c0_seq1.p1  ORF type:complete len:326 (-),score=27.81 gnl/TRDRNA2_/TRDRNA2_173472_c0_seq1:153-1130(-)
MKHEPMKHEPMKNETTKHEAENCLVDTPYMEAQILNNQQQVDAWKTVASHHAQTFQPITTEGKVAFLFMIGEQFPHEELWARWLAAAPTNSYTVVVHDYTGKFVPKTEVFVNRAIPPVSSSWCQQQGIILALNRKALEDPLVSKTIIICESTVPIKPFHVVYRNLGNESQMCMDTEWWNRGMPFSYLWNRFDAELFTQNEILLSQLFYGVHANCPPEDWFVVPLKLAGRKFGAHCVTWSGWYADKGFNHVTNGKHYDRIIKDVQSKYTPSDCGHPLTLLKISGTIMDGMVDDPSFFFARKFTKNTMIDSYAVDVYLQSALYLIPS